MKAKYLKAMQFLLIGLMISSIAPLWAQNKESYISISGTIKDKQSKNELESANISVPKTEIGTISNEDGVFSIKIRKSLHAKTLQVSLMGYFNQQVSINDADMHDLIIYLSPNDNKLQEVVIQAVDPLELVTGAIQKIETNNSPNASLLTGFYRETIKKKRNYINISEAVIDIYKTAYTESDHRDRVQVFKGRKLLSPKPGDTLLVKFIGGPNLSTYLDVVKNRDILLNMETLANYKFTMEDPVLIDERLHYVVGFEPQVTLPDALFYGKLYIDRESLAFSRAEFNLSLDDENKATLAILKKKPFKMHFKPEEVSFLVTYKEQNGRSYLNYVRNEVKFKCDWKRRLFSTNYTIVSEMVVTDKKDENIENIPSKLAFDKNQSLSDKVSNFYDSNFWGNYNIIEPSESLEAAVSKLKKQQ